MVKVTLDTAGGPASALSAELAAFVRAFDEHS